MIANQNDFLMNFTLLELKINNKSEKRKISTSISDNINNDIEIKSKKNYKLRYE